jgi:hypothetical protein
MNKLLPLTDNKQKKWLKQWTSRDWNPETYISCHMYIYNCLLSECHLQRCVCQAVPWEFYNIQPNARAKIKIEREMNSGLPETLLHARSTFQYFSTGVSWREALCISPKRHVINYQFWNNFTPDTHSELHERIFVAHHISGYDIIKWPWI